MSNMLNDLESKTIGQLQEILEDLVMEQQADDAEVVKLTAALTRITDRNQVRAQQLRVVEDALRVRNP